MKNSEKNFHQGMLENYSTNDISITQGVSHGDCPNGFTRLLCSEKNWRIMQPTKARSNDHSMDSSNLVYYQSRFIDIVAKSRICNVTNCNVVN